jgi:hypothetical protein
MGVNEDAIAAALKAVHPQKEQPTKKVAAATGLRIIHARHPLTPPRVPRNAYEEVKQHLIEGSLAATRLWMASLGVTNPDDVEIAVGSFRSMGKGSTL